MERRLDHVLKMLERAGINAGASIAGTRVFVWVDAPGQDTASFNSKEAALAADWLVARVMHLHPGSDLAKVWKLIAAARAAAAQGKG